MSPVNYIIFYFVAPVRCDLLQLQSRKSCSNLELQLYHSILRSHRHTITTACFCLCFKQSATSKWKATITMTQIYLLRCLLSSQHETRPARSSIRLLLLLKRVLSKPSTFEIFLLRLRNLLSQLRLLGLHWLLFRCRIACSWGTKHSVKTRPFTSQMAVALNSSIYRTILYIKWSMPSVSLL